jgi:hypothetical protein
VDVVDVAVNVVVDVVVELVVDEEEEEEEDEVVLVLDTVLLEGDAPVWPLRVSKPGR